MARRTFEKKPLYRKVNRCTHSIERHFTGGDARWVRNAKERNRVAAERGTLGRKHFHGLDYTPLFRFLLKSVGECWTAVRAEAAARLPKDSPHWSAENPIFWMVHDPEGERDHLRAKAHPFFHASEFALFSTLLVDGKGDLRKLDPDFGIEHVSPYCPCHTHTFNGSIVTNPCTNPSFVGGEGQWRGFDLRNTAR